MRVHNSPLLNKVSLAIRTRHYSPATERTYIGWIKRYILHHGKCHPDQMGTTHIGDFLTHLAVREHVAAGTQNQALCALVFLYTKVLGIELEGSISAFRAKRPRRRPVVLTPDEVFQIVDATDSDESKLMIQMLYGCGFRLKELLALRVKDIDFGNRLVQICDGKGMKDRLTMLPEVLVSKLQEHLENVRNRHQEDLERGYGITVMPDAMDRKFPAAPGQWKWQFVFPSTTLCRDPKSQRLVRFHRHPSSLQKPLARAVQRSGITKRVTCHTFRHTFASHLFESGIDSRRVQEILGHKSLKTTEQYLHVFNRGRITMQSPLDQHTLQAQSLPPGR
ncbi:MAG: integron integrase [Candidatus Latescibacteria bacterium]|nr:integron integrase [Candidatus Latescibacterota bacterium]